MTIIVRYPPEEINDCTSKTIFLAGSIEMGKAVDWQSALIGDITKQSVSKDVFILNPRRPDWKNWSDLSVDNPEFVEQVEWELRGLRLANIIVMFFAENTISPISLLEFGLNAESGKLVVYCEKGYSRKGNVDIVCRTYGITQASSYTQLLEIVMDRLVNDKFG